ncbi:MAG: zinc ABC transporter substrate-binding protein [Thermoguttaceae bacterium]
MRLYAKIVGCVLVAMMLLLAGCGSRPAARPDEGRLHVFAGIPPVEYLVRQIGGSHVSVDVLVRPGQDPHTFQPTPQQALALAQAKVFFKIGMPFEDVVLAKMREAAPQLAVVDVAGGVKKRMGDGCCHDHEHEEHALPDPHVWLSPPLLKIEAANVAAGLSAADPTHTQEYRRNLASLVDRIDAVHRKIAKRLTPYRGRTFFVFHPGFGYFADAYGLKEEAVEAGGRQPATKQLRDLIQKAKAEGVSTVFMQPEFDPRSAEVVAQQIGGRVVTINGLGSDVLADLEDIAEKIETSFSGNAPRRRGERGDGDNQGGLTPRREGAKNEEEATIGWHALKGRGGECAWGGRLARPFQDVPRHLVAFFSLSLCALAPLRKPSASFSSCAPCLRGALLLASAAGGHTDG